MKLLFCFTLLCISNALFAQKSFLDTLKVIDTVLFETTVSSASWNFIKNIPDKNITGGIEVHQGDKVKLASFTEGENNGLCFFWKLSTGGYIKDEILTQTDGMIKFKEKEMIAINKRIDEKIRKQEEPIKLQEEKEIARLDSIFGKKYGALIYHHMLWIGMTDHMAEYSLGAPDRINRTTYSSGIKEQWVYQRKVHIYEPPVYLYFKNSKLTSYQDTSTK